MILRSGDTNVLETQALVLNPHGGRFLRRLPTFPPCEVDANETDGSSRTSKCTKENERCQEYSSAPARIRVVGSPLDNYLPRTSNGPYSNKNENKSQAAAGESPR